MWWYWWFLNSLFEEMQGDGDVSFALSCQHRKLLSGKHRDWEMNGRERERGSASDREREKEEKRRTGKEIYVDAFSIFFSFLLLFFRHSLS